MTGVSFLRALYSTTIIVIRRERGAHIAVRHSHRTSHNLILLERVAAAMRCRQIYPNFPNFSASVLRSCQMHSKDSPSFKIILGSSSSSRKQILSDMGYAFSIIAADIDEKQIRMENPEDLVMALAEAKADAIIRKLQTSKFIEKNEPTLLITADQVVIHGGKIREKPSSREEAREFIKGYSEGHATTLGYVLVTNLKTQARKGGWDKAEVYFHKIPDEVIEKLVNEGNVLYVAGGLLVEHPLTFPFVKMMVGTLDSIMGLPKDLTDKLIQEVLTF